MTDPANAQHGIALELCVASLADAQAAAQAGAARVEINSAIELGGLTPSIGLAQAVVEALAQTPCRVIAMLRPRPAGFDYDQPSLRVMQADIAALINAGVHGIALGVLNPQGEIDAEACASLIKPIRSAGLDAVFHRAFDLTPDPHAALQTLIELGFTRVLTSGGKASAAQGADTLRSLIKHAAGRIEVLPGGGIRPDNVSALIAQTGCTQVHAALSIQQRDHSGDANPTLDFNAPPQSPMHYRAMDARQVALMLEAVAAR